MMPDDGLIHSYLFDGKGGSQNLQWEDINSWSPDQGLLWIHLSYTNEEAASWLIEKSGLDPVVAESLLSEESRPRAAVFSNGLLLNLRGMNHNPGSDQEDMVSIRIWAEEHRIISTRKRQILSIQDVTENFSAGNGPKSSGDFINTIVDLLSYYIEEAVNTMEDQLEQIEEDMVNPDNTILRSRISVIRRKSIMLRRYLAPQREAISRVLAETIAWLSERDKRQLHETANHLIRIVEDLDSIRDRALVAQEETFNQLSQQMNTKMYILSLMTAIFLPLTFLTGLLGINVGGIPGATVSYAFYVVAGLLLLVCIIQILYFRKKKWL